MAVPNGRIATPQGTEPSRRLASKLILISLYDYIGGKLPKAEELWRFPVDAKPGSAAWEDMRWIQVLIPHGQEQYLFAARPELRIPGAAPMSYVNDPTPATGLHWMGEDEGGEGGSYMGQYSVPTLVLGVWGRTQRRQPLPNPRPKPALEKRRTHYWM